jgi:hypothetical protein
MILASLLFLVSLAGAHAQIIERVEITEPGVYEAGVERIEPSPKTATGTVNSLTRVELVQKTTRIGARIGTRFGFRYRVIGEPKDGKANITFVTLYPAPGVRNPKTGNVTTRDEHTQTVDLNERGYRGFSFEENWEIVAGTWTLELWDGSRRLASQTFEIAKP